MNAGGTLVATHLTSVADEHGKMRANFGLADLFGAKFASAEPVEIPDLYLKLADGELVKGWIEYYDKNMVRLTREDQPNLFIFKHEIMYIAEDNAKRK